MLLSQLLKDVVAVETDIAITGMTVDSRRVVAGDLFVALPSFGAGPHGLQFVAAAEAAGAVAVLWDEADELPANIDIALIHVPNLAAVYGEIAGRFYHNPSQELLVSAVTGTDGKSSVAHMLAQCLHNDGLPTALMGTLGNGVFPELEPSTHTTMDAVSLQRRLRQFMQVGARAVALEASSHALDQGRMSGLDIDVAVLTNLGRDHLDYHGTVENYGAAKAKLFDFESLQAAVLNVDDEFGRGLAERVAPEVLAYGMAAAVRDYPQHVQVHFAPAAEGLRLRFETHVGAAEITMSVYGGFNAYNAAAVLGVMLVRDIELQEAANRLAECRTVPGRMEPVPVHAPHLPLVIVDYAHTPQALRAALTAARAHCRGKLLCVFGCGGDRDQGKRELMGQAASELADYGVVTNDNPRSESPAAIAADIMRGNVTENLEVVLDRSEAIGGAIHNAAANDVILIAGKGHETTQEIAGEKIAFSDLEVAGEFLLGLQRLNEGGLRG